MASNKTTVKLNESGMGAILTSDGVVADLYRRGEAIAAAAGDGFVARVSQRRDRRARVVVLTATPRAMRSEAKHRTLVRSLDAGRG